MWGARVAANIADMARRLTAMLCLALTAAWVGACGGDDADPEAASTRVGDPGPVHVHGLGVNPSDDALYIAAHTGLFRLPDGAERATRVGDRWQDTMGFTVVGPDRFLASGHPDGREDLPPFLGLIASTDAGGTWQPVSLLGEKDFHVLEAFDDRVWGFGSDFRTRREQLLVSRDGGRTWSERRTPQPLASLALDPDDPAKAIASGANALYATGDEGRSWQRIDSDAGLLAWPAADRLFRAASDGSVAVSRDRGAHWQRVGEIPGEPAAFEAAGGELFAALHDGTIVRSVDGGRSWSVRLAPAG